MNAYKKPFSFDDFAASDSLAKDTAIKFLEQQIPGSRVIRNPYTEFGVDLFIMLPVSGEENLYDQVPLEVEHRKSWKTKAWNFGDRLRLPGRKLKFQGSSFMVINDACTSAIYVPGDTPSKVTFFKTRYSTTEEIFIVYSLDDCTMLDLESDKIQINKL